MPKTYDTSRVEPPRLRGALGGDAKAKGYIIHVVDDDALVLWAIVGPAADMGLYNVAAVQERHFAVGLDPNLVAGMLCEDREGCDVKSELSSLGEFS